MTVVDLHPEELLDRDARGELDESERARLDAHLARCATCRFERQLRADFADELEAELPASAYAGLVEHLTATRQTPVPAPAPAPTITASAPEARESETPNIVPLVMMPKRRRPVVRAAWMLAAAAVFLGSVAGATGIGGRAWMRLVGAAPVATDAPSEVETVENGVTPKRATPPRPRPAPVEATPPVEQSPVDQAPSDEVPSDQVKPLAPSDVPAPIAIPSPSSTATNAAPMVRGVAHAPAHVAPSAPSAIAPIAAIAPASQEDAASLFEAASTARRRGDYAQALALHRKLESGFAQSREAHVAHATMGRLLLDRGDSSGALASFDAYLSTGGGDLGEEAMAGRATALERLGRVDDARRAWESLRALFPGTPFAAHAQARLEALSER